MKTQLSLAGIFLAGLLASGCSQMSAQQVAQAAPPPAPAPGKVITITDCSKWATQPRPSTGGGKKPSTGGGGLGGRHSHPAIPGCTNSITHSHPFTNARHQHSYSCKGGKPNRGKGPGRKPVMHQTGGKWSHTHPAIPGCTNSITHTHPYTNPNHSHHYSCRGGGHMGGTQQQQIIVPPVKAKGTFRGPIPIDGSMKKYQH